MLSPKILSRGGGVGQTLRFCQGGLRSNLDPRCKRPRNSSHLSSPAKTADLRQAASVLTSISPLDSFKAVRLLSLPSFQRS